MSIGLSTYAYFWRGSDRVRNPLSLDDMLRDTAANGVTVFQICDHVPLESYDDAQLSELRMLAESLGITLELGTRGTRPEHLRLYLRLAEVLGASLVRSMWTSGDDRPDASESERRLREVLPEFERAGITIALETYEQVSTADLVALIATIGSDNLGVCLDPANTVANLELPADVTALCAPYVENWHVKDFDFTRAPGWVGFELTGTALGAGRLAYDSMRACISPDTRGINQIIEFWLPWTVDATTTTRLEAEWTATTLEYLRSRSDD